MEKARVRPGRARGSSDKPCPLAPTAAKQAGLSRAAACHLHLGPSQGGSKSLPEDVFSALVGSSGMGAGRPWRNVAGQRGSCVALSPTGWSAVGQAGQAVTSLGALNSGHWVLGQLTSLPPVPASTLRCPMRGQVVCPQVGGRDRGVVHV